VLIWLSLPVVTEKPSVGMFRSALPAISFLMETLSSFGVTLSRLPPRRIWARY